MTTTSRPRPNPWATLARIRGLCEGREYVGVDQILNILHDAEPYIPCRKAWP